MRFPTKSKVPLVAMGFRAFHEMWIREQNPKGGVESDLIRALFEGFSYAGI